MQILPPKQPPLAPGLAEQLEAWGVESVETSLEDLGDSSSACVNRDGRRIERRDIEAWLKWKEGRKDYWSQVPKWAAACFSLLAAVAGLVKVFW
jgi:hypothetical protein